MTANFGQLLIRTARARANHVGLVDGDERLTWDEVLERSSVLARHLKSLGLVRGSRVAICAEHGLAQAIGLFAVALSDGVFTVVSPILKLEQTDHQLLDCEATFVVGVRSRLEGLSEILSRRKAIVVEVDSYGRLSGEVSDRNDLSPGAIPSDVACLIYTSGSTGKPKGVVVPHRTIMDGGRIVSGYLKIGPDDITLSVLPLSFDYGFNQLITALTVGARLVFHRYLLPTDFFRILVSERITGFAAVPTLWPWLLHPRFKAAWPEETSLRYVTTAGGPHNQQLLETVSKAFPSTEIIVMYGLTESFRSCYLPFSEIFKRPGSIGRPVPEVEILVMDEHGNHCPPGVKGELYHRGAFVNYGYLNDPALTAAKYVELPRFGPGVRPEIVVRSGDVVEWDNDGYLIFHGRADNQIKVLGFRVSPSEIEEVGTSIEGLSECAAVGIPDDEMGQAIVLFYTTFDAGGRDIGMLKEHFAAHLPSYAIPRKFIYIEKFPQTSTGKIDYSGLRRAASASNG